jgi:hypothetical protein
MCPGPPITSTSEQKASVLISKQNGSDLANGPFIMMTPTMSTYSQQLWVIAKVTTDNKDGERIYMFYPDSVLKMGLNPLKSEVHLHAI